MKLNDYLWIQLSLNSVFLRTFGYAKLTVNNQNIKL